VTQLGPQRGGKGACNLLTQRLPRVAGCRGGGNGIASIVKWRRGGGRDSLSVFKDSDGESHGMMMAAFNQNPDDGAPSRECLTTRHSTLSDGRVGPATLERERDGGARCASSESVENERKEEYTDE
jgi:hypothetical protein